MLRIEAFPNASWPWPIETLHWAYLISGLLIVAHYGPLLRRAWLHTEATALAQSLLTWTVWTACRLVALSYGLFVLHDAVFLMVVGADVSCRFAMATLIVRARHVHRRRQAAAAVDRTQAALDLPLLPQGGGEQQSRLIPVATHRPVGDVQRLGDLQIGHADEVAHFHHANQPRIKLRELLQRFMHLQDLFLAGRRPVDDLGVQRQVLGDPAAPLGNARAREVDNDRAHGAGAIGEEMIAVARQQAAGGAELQVTLIDERRRVEQRLLRTAADAAAGQAVQLGVQRLEKIVERSAVALARPLDQNGDVAHGVYTLACSEGVQPASLPCADPPQSEALRCSPAAGFFAASRRPRLHRRSARLASWVAGAGVALAAAGCQPSSPAPTRAPSPMGAALASVTRPDTVVTAALQRHAVAAFVQPFIDDSDPPRFTTTLRPLLCANHSSMSMDGRQIVDGDPVPLGAFTLQWDMDLYCPFGVAGPLLSGRVEVVVFRDDTHGLDAVLRPVTLDVLEPPLLRGEHSGGV